MPSSRTSAVVRAQLIAEIKRGPSLYSIEELAIFFGVGRRTIERRLESGEIEFVRVSPRRRRITKSALIAYAEARTQSDHGKVDSGSAARL